MSPRLGSKLVAAVLLNVAAATRAMSDGYVMERMTVAAGAQAMTSSAYQSTPVAGQMTPVGVLSACNAGSVASFGYWSVLGDLPIPMILQVQVNSLDPSAVDLSWTGTSARFQICRGSTAQNLCAAPYAFSFVCQFTDAQAQAQPALFYSVIPAP